MSNLLNPTAVLFINSNLSTGVLEQLVRQLSISDVLTAEEFDGYAEEDGYYTEHVHGLEQRILVLRDLMDYTNRDKADAVLCYSNGLVYVEESKFGPPGKALSLQNVYLRSLLF